MKRSLHSAVLAFILVCTVAGSKIANAQIPGADSLNTQKITEMAKEKATIHLNTASAAELAQLPGIGPAKAQAIIEARPFKSVDDLKKVKGIKEAVFAQVKSMVSL